ncbi:MAG TPA: serine hydrolase domain-containing protein [Vicinamibacterales bacterium]|nr:serine hydrolase domain-containing protein [Vicinamibacterales bacterium]
MTKRWLPAAGLVLALATTASLSGQQYFPSDAAIREIAQRAVLVTGNIGLVIGVLEADGTRRVITVGNMPYDGRTLFEIGSITKAFTGILLAEMAERGELRLDQPIAELLPATVSIPSRNGRQIRLVDLATHSSGLPRMPDNFTPADRANPYADYTVAQLYDFLRRHELRRDIGSEHEYSNLGVGLLGHALALRAGTSYEALVTERVLQPLGMSSTKISLLPTDGARLAPGHNARGEQVGVWDLPTLAGAGALRSSAEDMLTFLAANLDPPATSTLGRAIRQSHAPRFTIREGRRVGLLWGLPTTQYGRTLIVHNGGTGGYRTFAGCDPDRRIAVVVLSNQTAQSVDPIGMHLLDPRHPVSLEGLRTAFEVMAVTLAVLLVAGLFAAWRRTGATVLRSTLAASGMALGLVVWMTATFLAADIGLLHFARPPTMIVLFILLFALTGGLGVSRVGGRLAAGLPVAVLVGAQSFRLPLELMLHRAYEAGLMPVQMSYSGLNFDIVTGSTAIVVAVLVATGRAGLRVVRAWNWLGTLLLANIIVIAWLSAPTPLRVFKNEPANVWVTTEPYVWLPAVMVAFAVLGHIVVFRCLRSSLHER